MTEEDTKLTLIVSQSYMKFGAYIEKHNLNELRCVYIRHVSQILAYDGSKVSVKVLDMPPLLEEQQRMQNHIHYLEMRGAHVDWDPR